jgi:hypothetical protein
LAELDDNVHTFTILAGMEKSNRQSHRHLTTFK